MPRKAILDRDEGRVKLSPAKKVFHCIMTDHHYKKQLPCRWMEMTMDEIQVLFNTPMQLGECPLWHPDEAALYWIDIAGLAIHRHHPASGAHSSWPLPSEPGCIARSSNGRLLVAMRSGLATLDTGSGSLAPLAAAPYDTTKMRFNDGRCDAAGRLWAGTLYEPRDQALGSLFCVQRGAIRDAGKPVIVSNGLAFSVDNRTLYHADTTAHRISAYDFDVATGRLGNGRLFKQFSTDKSHQYGGRPDGAAVDSEDAYWCAMYEGGRVLRLSPSGDVLREIALPVRCPTMIAFGGADLRTLYITSARHNRSAAELARHPLSGCVLTLRVDVPGRPEPAYIP
jgi:sugar lactone lactonase YvrE